MGPQGVWILHEATSYLGGSAGEADVSDGGMFMVATIAVFNHKGGVSKTTTTFNLGWALAKQGKRVILVDADAQCNLTLYAMGYSKYEEFVESNPTQNINHALAPAYKSQPRYIAPFATVAVEGNAKLSIIPGHLDFTENEVQLGMSLQLSDSLGAIANLPGAFAHLVRVTAEEQKADIVLVDMNPSLSSLNQNILMSCTHFLVPTSPDFFSVSAITSLARVVPSWEGWARRARPRLQDAIYPLPLVTPKFLGYTINDFNLSSGQAQGSFRVIMSRISEEVVKRLVPALGSADMLLDFDTYASAYEQMRSRSENGNISYDNPYCLAEISNFNKLIALSNEKSIPVFELRDQDVAFHEGQVRTLKWFRFLYSELARRVIVLVKPSV